MRNKHLILTTPLFFFFAMLMVSASAQNIIRGVVTSQDKEPLITANITLLGSPQGTITDFDGKFLLETKMNYPLTIEVSYLGLETRRIVILENGEFLEIKLEDKYSYYNPVVVAASKVEEKIMEAPVTIEVLDLKRLQGNPSLSAYDALDHIKGVQSNKGGLTFNSINTRGFADMQNWRFVQLIDGMNANSPGLNYPIGGNSGPADIDIASIELVPGANSALYGANAFNGILLIKTKDPFANSGLSAYVKSGVTIQEAGGTNPLFDVGARFAKAYNDKFALKLNFGILNVTDWTANDESYYINNQRIAFAEDLLKLPRNTPTFDAVNVYGDEIGVPVILAADTDPVTVNRTGIKEADLLDYKSQVYKYDAALYYRLTDNTTASYSFRQVIVDAVLRHTTIYPFRNVGQLYHRFNVKNKNWELQAYYSKENANGTYLASAAAGFIEQARKSNVAWGADYGAAFRGEVAEVKAGDHDAARIYADRDLPAPDSDTFAALRETTLNNSDLLTGGSQLVDNTNLFNVTGSYYFESLKETIDLNIGGNMNRYSLDSDGALFNDGALGFGAPIPVNEYGGFVQVGKKLADKRIKLQGSIRADKHQDFEFRLSPRASAVLTLDEKRKQFARFSIQSAFRNPASQEGFINLDVGTAVLLGGIENNITTANFQRADGVTFSGQEIYESLITLESYIKFLGTGSTDPTVIEAADIPFLQQEKNTTWEIGYKGLINNRLFIDLNYYRAEYEDLIVRRTSISPLTGRAYAIYTNIPDKVTSSGLGASLEYFFTKNVRGRLTYNLTIFDAEEAVENTPDFIPSFNTPKHRINASVSSSKIGNTDLGFDLKYRYWNEYVWESPFGQSPIEANGVLDAALSYKLKSLKSVVKLGINNLLNKEYTTVYGGPQIGSIYYLSWTYDGIMN